MGPADLQPRRQEGRGPHAGRRRMERIPKTRAGGLRQSHGGKNVKKLMFYELAEGHFSEQVQKDFEEAQAVAHDRGVPAKVDIQITVFPESRAHRGTGKVKFRSTL